MTPADLDRALGAWRSPELSRDFADRVLAEAARPGRRRAAAAASSRAARRPWMRRRLVAGVVLLNLLAASAIAAVLTGHAPLATIASLSHRLFALSPVDHVAKVERPHRVVAHALPAPRQALPVVPVIAPVPAPVAAAPLEVDAPPRPLVAAPRIAARAIAPPMIVRPRLAAARPRPIAPLHRRAIERVREEASLPRGRDHAEPRRERGVEIARERQPDRPPAFAPRTEPMPRAGEAGLPRQRFEPPAAGAGIEGGGQREPQPGIDRPQRRGERADGAEGRREPGLKRGGEKRGGWRLGRGWRRRL